MFLRGFFLLLCCFPLSAVAITWNEPWHREVVQQADAFGLYQVTGIADSSVTFRKLKPLAGVVTGDEIAVDGYYALQISSMSGDGIETAYVQGRSYYLFLKKGEGDKSWLVATPTASLNELTVDGVVAATFRHSAHQAWAEQSVYELTQICIFNYLHDGKRCEDPVYAFIDDAVSGKPGVLSATATKQEADRFFRQHAALETAYLIRYPLPEASLLKFIQTGFFHSQISANRALSVSNSARAAALLLDFVKNNENEPLAQVFAVLSIGEMGARELRDPLLAFLPAASEEEVGLTGMMDPRIGTAFPDSVKAAIESVIESWASESSAKPMSTVR